MLEVISEPRETDPLKETAAPQDESQKNRSALQGFFRPCMEDHYPHEPADASPNRRLFRSFLCPPHGPVANAVSGILVMALIWSLSLVIFREKAQPGSEVFAVLSMLTSAMAGGYLFKVIRLPALVGMMLVGLAWRNVQFTELVDMESQISDETSFFFRNCALAVIILRAGMSLNPEILKRDWPVILRFGLIPCTLEALTWSAAANLILNLPWIWAFLLGSVISAASAAVVIPAMLHLQEIGLGTDKGIPTITMAATSVDNVLALSLFGLLNSIAFSEGSIAQSVAHVPAQIAVGVAFGIAWGFLLRYFPSPDMQKGYVLTGRIFILVGGAFLAVFGSNWFGYSAAGSLACLILAYVASVSWRQKSGWGENCPNPVAEALNGLWVFLEPMLFALIGSQIALKDLNGRVVGYGILCMIISLLVRWIVTLISLKGVKLNWKDCFFMAITWLPKATVQAALGPVVWATARQTKAGPQMEDFGHTVMSLSALSILITAPVGALAIKFSGPCLLNKTTPIALEGDPPVERHPADPVVNTTV